MTVENLQSESVYREEELLPVSGLQHLLYCRRRAALVHLEGIWDDNVFTATGSIRQERVDAARRHESRPGVRVVRGLLVRSLRLGLTGKCDVVEFRTDESAENAEVVFPIEYKRGALREEEGYLVQLCAQAVCLEEMLGASIPEGAIFFAASGRRLEVSFDEDLRCRTINAARDFHDLILGGITPAADHGSRCEKCSLSGICLPRANQDWESASAYLETLIREEDEP